MNKVYHAILVAIVVIVAIGVIAGYIWLFQQFQHLKTLSEENDFPSINERSVTMGKVLKILTLITWITSIILICLSGMTLYKSNSFAGNNQNPQLITCIVFIVLITFSSYLVFEKAMISVKSSLYDTDIENSKTWIIIYAVLQFLLLIIWIWTSVGCRTLSEEEKYMKCHPFYEEFYNKVNSSKQLKLAQENVQDIFKNLHKEHSSCISEYPDKKEKKQELQKFIQTMKSSKEAHKLAGKAKELFPKCNYNECKLKEVKKSFWTYHKCHPFYADFDNAVGGFDSLSDAKQNPSETVDYLFEKHKDCISRYDNIDEKKNKLKNIISEIRSPYDSVTFSTAAADMFPECNKNICK